MKQGNLIRQLKHSRQNDMKVAVSKAVNVSGVQFVIAVGIAMIIMVRFNYQPLLLLLPVHFWRLLLPCCN